MATRSRVLLNDGLPQAPAQHHSPAPGIDPGPAPPARPGSDAHGGRGLRVRRRLLVGADVLGFLIAVVVLSRLHGAAIGAPMLVLVAVGAPVVVLAAKMLGLYDREIQHLLPSTLDEVPRLLIVTAIGVLVATFVAVSAPGGEVLTRWDVVLLWVCTVAVGTLARLAARKISRRVTTPERVVILGDDPLADVLADSCAKRPLDVELATLSAGDLDAPGAAAAFARTCVAQHVERVVLMSDRFDAEVTLDLVRELRRAFVRVSLVPRVAEETGARVLIEHVDGIGVMGVPPIARSRSTMTLKRAFDMAVTIPALVVLSPAMLVIALAVRLTSKGPILYRQDRVGRHGQTFTMLKFRTMYDGAHADRASLQAQNSHGDPRLFKLDVDPRVTAVGRRLRSTSLDELPQLLNVLRGSMSIVGPRPLLPEEDGHIVGWRRRRLDISPGLTGPWQVLQAHRVPFDAMVKIDYLYVLEWSPWTDVKIILRTFHVVLARHSR